MSYLYVTDEILKDELLNKNYKLIEQMNTNNKTWVFEINPSLFDCQNADIETFKNNNKCFISHKLKMTF